MVGSVNLGRNMKLYAMTPPRATDFAVVRGAAWMTGAAAGAMTISTVADIAITNPITIVGVGILPTTDHVRGDMSTTTAGEVANPINHS